MSKNTQISELINYISVNESGKVIVEPLKTIESQDAKIEELKALIAAK